MKFIIIIPARFASTRFPGKPLVFIHGKPMIQHVFEKCKMVVDDVFVATDDDRIAEAVKVFSGNVVLTSPDHTSGTDRCAEAASQIAKTLNFDVVINVQGDEPFIEENQIQRIIECFDNADTDIATLIAPINSTDILFDKNKVKVVTDKNNFALYFSRQAIPCQRDVEPEHWLNNHSYNLHVGMYAFRKKVLDEVTKLDSSTLELTEKLEQLRWLENGYRIKTAHCSHASLGIDTPEDLEKI